MRTKLARDAAVSLAIFAAAFAISRSNLTVAGEVRSYLRVVLTQSTELADLAATLRDAASRLLAGSPWQGRTRSGGRAGGLAVEGGAQPGGPSGARTPAMPGRGQPATESASSPGTGSPGGAGSGDAGALYAGATPGAVAAIAGQPATTATRGESGARALPPSMTRAAVPRQDEQGGGGRKDSATDVPHSTGTDSPPPGARQEGWNGMEPAPSSSASPSATLPGGAKSVDPEAGVQKSGGTVPSTREPAKLAPPVSGRVTYGFGYRTHPIYQRRLLHEGIDVAAPLGTPIRAAAAGRVIRAGSYGTYGKVVELDHGGRLRTLYAHCSRVLVRAGTTVRVGQKIAEVGSTGLSTGPHLHFEVSLSGKPVDPFAYLEGGRRDRL